MTKFDELFSLDVNDKIEKRKNGNTELGLGQNLKKFILMQNMTSKNLNILIIVILQH